MEKVWQSVLILLAVGCAAPQEPAVAPPENLEGVDSVIRLTAGPPEAPEAVGEHPLFPVEVRIDSYLEVRDTEFFTEGQGSISLARGQTLIQRLPHGILIHIYPRASYRGHTVVLLLHGNPDFLEARATAVYLTDELLPKSLVPETVSGIIWLKSADLGRGRTVIGRFRLRTKWSSLWEEQEVRADLYSGTFIVTLS